MDDIVAACEYGQVGHQAKLDAAREIHVHAAAGLHGERARTFCLGTGVRHVEGIVKLTGG